MQKFKHRAVSTGVSKQRALAAVPENEEELKDDDLTYSNAFQKSANRRLSVRNSDPAQMRSDTLGETCHRSRLHHALTTNLNENNASSTFLGEPAFWPLKTSRFRERMEEGS